MKCPHCAMNGCTEQSGRRYVSTAKRTFAAAVFGIVLMAICAVAQDTSQDASVLKAIEGARKLHEAMRDPDSFKIGKVWIMRSEKYGDAIYYDFYSRNGYGGMNASHADYAPHTKKDVAAGKYILDSVADESFEFLSRCGARAEKHDAFVKDVTKEVKDALSHD